MLAILRVLLVPFLTHFVLVFLRDFHAEGMKSRANAGEACPVYSASTGLASAPPGCGRGVWEHLRGVRAAGVSL